MTTIRFTLRGACWKPVEIYQFKTVKFLFDVKQGEGSSAEYKVNVPAVFDSIPFRIDTGDAQAETGARLIGVVSGVDPGIARLFGTAGLDRRTMLKTLGVLALYLLGIMSILQMKVGPARAAALAAASVLFAVAAVVTLGSGITESSVTLLEGTPGRPVATYEFIGLGSPFGATAALARENGVLFPVHETVQGLFGDNARIELRGRGSATEGIVLERGRPRVFCCLAEDPLRGRIDRRGGQFVNRTGKHLPAVYLRRDGRFFDLGSFPDGARRDAGDVPAVSREDVIRAVKTRLEPAALRLFVWRLGRSSIDKAVVFGSLSRSDIFFFEVESGEAKQNDGDK